MTTQSLLNLPMLALTPYDKLSLADVVQNIFILGGIGSGKTSGSAKAIRAAFLRARMGGIVLCAKPEEAAMWRAECAQHGRSRDLIVWDGTNGGFNFLAWLLALLGPAGTSTAVELLLRIVEMAKLASGANTRPGESFWEDTIRQVLRHAVPILLAATGTIRIADLLRLVRSAPQSPEQMKDPSWQRDSFFFQAMLAAADRLDDATGDRLASYWRDDWARLDAKTRGNIAISLTTTLDRFNHGWLADAFCGETNLVPELTFHGTILVLDMPALTKLDDGIVGQQLVKYCWQQVVLMRNAFSPEQARNPVFCYADEAHLFANSADATFLSLSRSSLSSTVYISQSLPSYYAKLGGDGGHDRVHHLISNFAHLVFHSNGCTTTNKWASETIGRTVQRRGSFNQGQGSNRSSGFGMSEGDSWSHNTTFGRSHTSGRDGGSVTSSFSSGGTYGGNDGRSRNHGSGTSENRSWGYSEQMDHLIEPSAFGQILKTGGRSHRGRVSAVWYSAGKRFEASGSNTLLVEFQQ